MGQPEPFEMVDPLLADFAAADAAALDALYDFERYEREGITPDDAKTRLELVLWHMAALAASVDRCLTCDGDTLAPTEQNALHALLVGHDTAAARVEAAYRRLADAGGAGEGEGVAS